jgi:hypothetical protein
VSLEWRAGDGLGLTRGCLSMARAAEGPCTCRSLIQARAACLLSTSQVRPQAVTIGVLRSLASSAAGGARDCGGHTTADRQGTLPAPPRCRGGAKNSLDGKRATMVSGNSMDAFEPSPPSGDCLRPVFTLVLAGRKRRAEWRRPRRATARHGSRDTACATRLARRAAEEIATKKAAVPCSVRQAATSSIWVAEFGSGRGSGELGVPRSLESRKNELGRWRPRQILPNRAMYSCRRECTQCSPRESNDPTSNDSPDSAREQTSQPRQFRSRTSARVTAGARLPEATSTRTRPGLSTLLTKCPPST